MSLVGHVIALSLGHYCSYCMQIRGGPIPNFLPIPIPNTDINPYKTPIPILSTDTNLESIPSTHNVAEAHTFNKKLDKHLEGDWLAKPAHTFESY